MKDNIIGKVFNQLTVIKLDHKKKYNKYYLCKCTCGNTCVVFRSHLISGHTKSCGCTSNKRRRESLTTHGKSGSKLYKVYYEIRNRCCNPHSNNYYKYGAKGITICKEWLENFNNFYNWAIANGYKEGLSIDRINTLKNYSPDNCRWVNSQVQAMNKPLSKANTSGYLGVNFNKSKNKWVARIIINGVRKEIGTYDTAEEAHTARISKIKELNNSLLNEQFKYEN